MDLEYIDKWSLWLDFKILLKTMLALLNCFSYLTGPAVISGKGAY